MFHNAALSHHANRSPPYPKTRRSVEATSVQKIEIFHRGALDRIAGLFAISPGPEQYEVARIEFCNTIIDLKSSPSAEL